MFKYTSSGQEVFPVSAKPGKDANAGDLIGFAYTDAAKGNHDIAVNNVILGLSTVTQASSGLIQFMLTDTAPHDFIAVANKVGG